MNDPNVATDGNVEKRTPFKQLSRRNKAIFVCKLIICIATGGFVFPNLM